MDSRDDRLFRIDWAEAVAVDLDGVPRLSPRFVAEAGRRVLVIDVREAHELEGPLGVLPGARHLPLASVDALRELPRDALLVLVSGHGGRALAAARRLLALGMTHVAVLDGGLTAFRQEGYATLHDVELPDGTPPAPRDRTTVIERPLPPAAGRRVDRASIEAHVGTPESVRWMKLAAFLLHGRTACVDGRDSHGVIGTPGGDVGEIVLALAAVETVVGPVDDRIVPALLRDYVEAFGACYLHTDHGARERLLSALRADPRVDAASVPRGDAPEGAYRRFLRSPDPELVGILRELVVRPELVGCGHLRLLLGSPVEYGVREGLAARILVAYFDAYWDGLPELELVSLSGGHEESGVLLVESREPLHPYTRIPLVSPRVEGEQLFVHHPQITAFQRAQIDAFFVGHPLLPGLAGKLEALSLAHAELGSRQLEITLSRLAAGLPIFRARFGRDRGFEVDELGRVPEPKH